MCNPSCSKNLSATSAFVAGEEAYSDRPYVGRLSRDLKTPSSHARQVLISLSALVFGFGLGSVCASTVAPGVVQDLGSTLPEHGQLKRSIFRLTCREDAAMVTCITASDITVGLSSHVKCSRLRTALNFRCIPSASLPSQALQRFHNSLLKHGGLLQHRVLGYELLRHISDDRKHSKTAVLKLLELVVTLDILRLAP